MDTLLIVWEWIKTEGVGLIVTSLPFLISAILFWVRRKLNLGAEQTRLQIEYMDRLAKKEDLRPQMEIQSQRIDKLNETLNNRDSAIQALFEIITLVFSNMQSLSPEIKDNVKNIYNKTTFGAREDEVVKLNTIISSLKDNNAALTDKLEKMKENAVPLKSLPVSIYRGVLTGYNEAFYIDSATRARLLAEDPRSAELIRPMVRGRDIVPYGISDSLFLLNVHNGIKDIIPSMPPVNIHHFPAIKAHLDLHLPMLEKRGDRGITPYNLRNCAYLAEFDKPKIIYPNMTSVFPFMYDESGLLCNDKSFILTANDESISLLYLVALLNSSSAKLWIWYNCPELQGGTREIRKVYFEHFPVPVATAAQQQELAELAKLRIDYSKRLQQQTGKFTRNLQREFNIDKPSNRLQNWHELSYKEFVKELEKNKIKLSLPQKAAWEEYFTNEAQQTQTLQHQIAATDQQINQAVEVLYGLSNTKPEV